MSDTPATLDIPNIYPPQEKPSHRLDLTYEGEAAHVSINLIELCKQLFGKRDG